MPIIKSKYAGRCSWTKGMFIKRLRVQGDCLIWIGAHDRDGYGKTIFKGQSFRAHRLAYLFFCGELENGKVVMHSCDNPSCCNPDHLSLGTNEENRKDSVFKKRHRFGERHHGCKISDDVVRFILRSKDGNRILASRFSVTHQTISKIRRRQRRMDVVL